MKTYKLKQIDTEEVTEWTVKDILEEINRDRSDDWSPYDESDWREGWHEWCEGSFYTLVS